jgi:outer membrane usher protein
VHYTGNRANVSLSQDSRLAGLDVADVDQRTSLRVETALAFADGHVALGRPVSNGFAILTPYAGLADHEISVGKRDYGYVAHSDFLGPALLPSVSPYTLNRVDYDVADLPPGYDLGDGLFDLAPKHKSGYALKVGSHYTVTAVGTLLGAESKPLPLITGIASEAAHPEKKVELFTNRAGRFNAQGLAPGKWLIEMATEPVSRFELTIPPETVGLYRIETPLRPL